MHADITQRFQKSVKRTRGCWFWTQKKDRDGYGKILVHGKLMFAHRVGYEMVNGKIKRGLEIDHLCRNRGCVNPQHLEAVTHAVNMARGFYAMKKVCKNGHKFDKKNTYFNPAGRRACRKCQVATVARYKLRKALA